MKNPNCDQVLAWIDTAVGSERWAVLHKLCDLMQVPMPRSGPLFITMDCQECGGSGETPPTHHGGRCEACGGSGRVHNTELLKASLDAFDQLAATECSYFEEEELLPSGLLCLCDPLANPNSKARLTGDPNAVVQVLLAMTKDPKNVELRKAFSDNLVEFLELVA